MRRRDFIGFVGVAATAWPRAVRAEQPVKNVGFLSVSSPRVHAIFVTAFKEGLRRVGFIEGQNLRMEYAWAEGRFESLPELASGLVRDKVDVIAAMSGDRSAQRREQAPRSRSSLLLAVIRFRAAW
jgi:putative ABC transport system substrate-binding protein